MKNMTVSSVNEKEKKGEKNMKEDDGCSDYGRDETSPDINTYSIPLSAYPREYERLFIIFFFI
jgi:hypothetical protein